MVSIVVHLPAIGIEKGPPQIVDSTLACFETENGDHSMTILFKLR
jgi:hypothetical protein